MTTIETASGIAIKKVVGEESVALTKFFKEKIKKKWHEHVGENELKKYQSKIVSYFYFFTINNPDQKTYIGDIYVPLNIETMDGHTFKIESLLNKGQGFSVVSGVAGHGKSTFLRHLMWQLIIDENSTQIPIFFELKYFKDDTIENQICEWLNNCGLSIEVSFIRTLLKKNKLTVFLDAFDELPSNLMDLCEQRIVEFSQKFCNTNIIVTTRPNLQISQNPLGNHFKMTDLTRSQIFNILSKICNTNEEASNTANAIFSSDFVSEAIKTPILAILVSLTYKRWNCIPETMSEFYNRVFNTLLSIHDNTKSGKRIQREINSTLEDIQILSVINQLSYYLTIEEKYSFTKLEFDQACLKSLNKKSFDAKELKSIFKCLKNACNILVKDGFDEYKYIHRSFQEFYSSKYIESLHHTKKKVFYSACLDDVNFMFRMRKLIEFLYELDEVYMHEFLIIPFLVKNKCINAESCNDYYFCGKVNLSHLINNIIESKHFSGDKALILSDTSNTFIYSFLINEDVISEISDAIDTEVLKNKFQRVIDELKPSHTLYDRFDMYPAKSIVNLFYENDDFIKLIRDSLEYVFIDAENSIYEKIDNFLDKTNTQDSDDISEL